MTRDNDRAHQQDARAWAARADMNYTTALRLVRQPLAQGILGPRVSARALLATLDQHPVLRDGALGEFGIRSPHALELHDREMLLDVTLAVEFLRMFGPARSSDDSVGSYTLKDTAEEFLKPALSYLSNGRLIWAAAHVGFPLRDEDGSLNVAVSLASLEHGYVRRSLVGTAASGRAHHNRPSGFEHLRAALDAGAASAPQRWDGISPDVPRTSSLHEWLIAHAPDIRDGSSHIDRLAYDYRYGVEHDDDPIAIDGPSFIDFIDGFGDFRSGLAARDAVATWEQELTVP